VTGGKRSDDFASDQISSLLQFRFSQKKTWIVAPCICNTGTCRFEASAVTAALCSRQRWIDGAIEDNAAMLQINL
jgi:hypothetical protein